MTPPERQPIDALESACGEGTAASGWWTSCSEDSAGATP